MAEPVEAPAVTDRGDIWQEKSFHWLRHGDPTSHSASTASDNRIGLLGFEGKFDEKLTQLFEFGLK